MITDPEKFNVKDKSGKTDVTFEVNWNPLDEDTNECKVLKIRIGKEETYIATGDLRTILFAISNPEEQRKAMPIQMVTQRRYQTILGVKADKDIKKGEMVNFKVDIPLPPIDKEIMLEATRQIKRGIVKLE